MIHTKPNNGISNDWLTPPWLLESLGIFRLDPCAHPDQKNETAVRMIRPPANGLRALWIGRVWLNPPYGKQIVDWMKKMAAHRNGIALVPSRTEVESWFWPYVWEAADAILFIRGRLYFERPDGSRQGNAGHGSVLVAYGPKNVTALEQSTVEGRIVKLK